MRLVLGWIVVLRLVLPFVASLGSGCQPVNYPRTNLYVVTVRCRDRVFWPLGEYRTCGLLPVILLAVLSGPVFATGETPCTYSSTPCYYSSFYSNNAEIITAAADMDLSCVSTIVRWCFSQLGFVRLGSANCIKKPILGWPTRESLEDVPSRPRFEDLPLAIDHPKASAWGLWGQNDERGTLNLITCEVVTLAKQEIKNGLVVSLK